MKILSLILRLFVPFFVSFELQAQTTVYDEGDIKNCIEFIKKNILDKKTNSIELEVANSHGGRYTVHSLIRKGNELVTINTDITDMSGKRSDTVFNYTLNELADKLTYESDVSSSQLIIAGNYQQISITANSHKTIFLSRKALGLLSLMSKGKSNITIPNKLN